MSQRAVLWCRSEMGKKEDLTKSSPLFLLWRARNESSSHYHWIWKSGYIEGTHKRFPVDYKVKNLTFNSRINNFQWNKNRDTPIFYFNSLIIFLFLYKKPSFSSRVSVLETVSLGRLISFAKEATDSRMHVESVAWFSK